MTQEATPVGGASDTVVAAEPTIEDRFAALAQDDGQDEERRPGDETEQSADAEQPELTTDDVPDEAETSETEELPPIAAPASWKAEEKEAFSSLPRALQETVTRREAERDKQVQAKSQEAAQTRSAVEREARDTIQQLNTRYVQQLQHFEAQFAVPEPDPQLIADDPELYAHQLQQHRNANAQRLQAQQQLAAASQQAEYLRHQATVREQETTRAALAESFPEYLDPTNGPKLREELGSTALELGYTAEQLKNVDHLDILAMRQANEWRQDSVKYRALMSKKMQGVRAAKDLPKVSKPGVASAPGAVVNERYAADRQRMKGGDKDATTRVFSKFL